MKDIKYFFFKIVPSTTGQNRSQLPEGYGFKEWSPIGPPVGWQRRVLRIVGFRRLAIWMTRPWAIRFFVITAPDGEVVHVTMVCPRSFRFPLIEDNELSLSGTSTASSHRNKGLYSYAFQEIPRICAREGWGPCWSVISENNMVPQRVLPKIGWHMAGVGSANPRFGTLLLGYYALGREKTS